MFCGDQSNEALGGRLKALNFKQASEHYFVAETSIGNYEIDKRDDYEDDGLVWYLWTPFKDWGDRFQSYEIATANAWDMHKQAALQLFDMLDGK